MPLNILVVDDSQFFQRNLSEMINEHPQLHVVGVAGNGREAVEKATTLTPDVITMDYEMPMLNGVSAVRTIMAENPLPILMLSSMTYEGAKITIDALEAGAADFMTKNFAEFSAKGVSIKKKLWDTLLALGNEKLSKVAKEEESSPSLGSAEEILRNTTIKKESTPAGFSKNNLPKIVAIGASTGGPAVLTELLKKLPRSFPCPIVVIQHMPENFTHAFSERLNNQCQLSVKEAEDGDILEAGKVFLAPGGRQMIIDKVNNQKLRIIDSTKVVNYRPSVDISLASLSNTYGRDTLAIVLTGMGADGRDGARLLKEQKAEVWTQAKETCVVYGMPMAIDKENLSSASLSPDNMAKHLSAW